MPPTTPPAIGPALLLLEEESLLGVLDGLDSPELDPPELDPPEEVVSLLEDEFAGGVKAMHNFVSERRSFHCECLTG